MHVLEYWLVVYIKLILPNIAVLYLNIVLEYRNIANIIWNAYFAELCWIRGMFGIIWKPSLLIGVVCFN